MDGYQVWKCPCISEIGQRSTGCKIKKTIKILLSMSWFDLYHVCICLISYITIIKELSGNERSKICLKMMVIYMYIALGRVR